jgi:hypothetical protein
VLPSGKEDSPGYKRTWFDRAGPDAGLRLKALGYGLFVALVAFAGLLLASLPGGVPSFGLVVGLLLAAGLAGAATTFVAAKLSDGAGAVVKSFIQPSGNSTPYEQTFSFQEAMVMRGDIAGALESFEAIIAEQPGFIAPRLRAAEHYARGNRNPKRAAELFREVRDLPGVPMRDAIYSSSRLVDLYDGALAEPGRAIVELRRIIERYPGSDLAKRARTALPALKVRLESERPI